MPRIWLMDEWVSRVLLTVCMRATIPRGCAVISTCCVASSALLLVHFSCVANC
jgi:hypothetical protein